MVKNSNILIGIGAFNAALAIYNLNQKEPAYNQTILVGTAIASIATMFVGFAIRDNGR